MTRGQVSRVFYMDYEFRHVMMGLGSFRSYLLNYLHMEGVGDLVGGIRGVMYESKDT
jgi:hypothetical protein